MAIESPYTNSLRNKRSDLIAERMAYSYLAVETITGPLLNFRQAPRE